jgi:hypothetical protein
MTGGKRYDNPLPERQDLTPSISPAFQAEDVTTCVFRRSKTCGYENYAFQARNDKKRKPNFKV